MSPIEEILKISQKLEQILQNQYGATGRGLREKADSVADQLPEETLKKISKLSAMRNKAAHENIALANEKIAFFRRVAGEVLISLMLYSQFEDCQKDAQLKEQTSCLENSNLQSSSSTQETMALMGENGDFSWFTFYQSLIPDIEQYLKKWKLCHELLKNYSPDSLKVQENVSQMLSIIEHLYGVYDESLQKRQKDLQCLIDEKCLPDSPIKISAQKDIDKLTREMFRLQPDHSAQSALKCIEAMAWNENARKAMDTIPSFSDFFRREFAPPKSNRAGMRKVVTIFPIEFAFRWCPPARGMRGFWLLETQVTQEMWQWVMGKNPSKFKGERNPVENVSVMDCEDFCRKMSQKLRQEVELPSEAAWEYACYAEAPKGYSGDLDSMAWYENNSDDRTHEVGLKQPNTWGLYDMYGNVWEWCSDYVDDEDKINELFAANATDFSASMIHVMRGGSWDYLGDREMEAANYRSDDVGFRILLVPEKEQARG